MVKISQFVTTHRALTVRLAAFSVLGASLLFSGCGGGAGTEPPAPAPSPASMGMTAQ